MSSLAIAVGWIATCFLEDQIGIVRVDALTSSSPVSVEFRPVTAAGTGFLGATSAQVPTIGKATGKKPIRYVFACDWDGDGVDEVVVVRERVSDPKHRLIVTAYRAPKIAGSKLGKVVGSLDSKLLTATGYSRVLALGAFDRNGDGKDELAVVRAAGTLEQRLEIYAIPSGKSKPLAAPIASDWTFGAPSEVIVGIDGVAKSVGTGENLAVVIRGPTAARVRILKPPVAPVTESNVLASAETVVASDGAVVEDGFVYAHADESPERIAMLFRADDGGARLESFGVPVSIGGALGPVLATESDIDVPGSTSPLFGLFASRRESGGTVDPWIDLVGPLSAWFRCAYPDGVGGFTSSWIGPIPAWPSQFVPSKTIRLIGVEPLGFGAPVDVDLPFVDFDVGTGPSFGEWVFDPHVLGVPADSDIAKKGDRCVFNFPTGLRIGLGPSGNKRFEYVNPGGSIFGTPIGELQFPDPSQPGGFGLRAAITEMILAK